MTEVLHSSPSHFPSSSIEERERERERNSSGVTDCDPNGEEVNDTAGNGDGEGGGEGGGQHLTLLALLVALIRKSLFGFKFGDKKGEQQQQQICSMEIGLPTNVRHVAHVTFDRFNGFLGLPVEFQPLVPSRAPSASITVFGVSTESMQLSYDSRGNSVPTILLLIQRRLYAQGGLTTEGIFRISGGNIEEEIVRDQLNRGVVPEDIDVHSLAGLIKAWFRELPTGILDSLSPEKVIQCETEDDCAEVVKLLPPIEAALLDWAINLMADVVQFEDVNRMNARNIATIFAPNMTHMLDPLTALMYAVKVMNFLKMLITLKLRERKESIVDPSPVRDLEPFDENGHESSSQICIQDTSQEEEEETELELKTYLEPNQTSHSKNKEVSSLTTSSDDTLVNETNDGKAQESPRKSKNTGGQSSNSSLKKGLSRKVIVEASVNEKRKEIRKLSRMNSRMELIEAWL
ncbi:rho GTPase-activating protein 5 [Cannabis sativa]|uniref:rho GTPase-activating protein 5 n=1 Tax=Cannabis sativa TaxID=3483 RepID=UPI0029CA0C6C|nr:rho GTPase-activating protein 5 [Cannabis sativa]